MIARVEPVALSPLVLSAVSRLFRIGAKRAERTPLEFEGHTYVMHVEQAARLVTHHITLEEVGGNAHGYRQSMVMLEVMTHDTHDVDGMGLCMKALERGVPLCDPVWPSGPRLHVLAHIPVPTSFADRFNASVHIDSADSTSIGPVPSRSRCIGRGRTGATS